MYNFIIFINKLIFFCKKFLNIFKNIIFEISIIVAKSSFLFSILLSLPCLSMLYRQATIISGFTSSRCSDHREVEKRYARYYGSEMNGSLVSLGILIAIQGNIVKIFWLRAGLVISYTEGSKRHSRCYRVSEVFATPFGSSFDGLCSRYCL